MEKKFEMTNEVIEFEGRILHRIRALKDFGNVKKGELGGFIGKEKNLSQVGYAWAYNNAKICDDAIVIGNANIKDNAVVKDRVVIRGNAAIEDDAVIGDSAVVEDNALVRNNALVKDEAIIRKNAIVEINACVRGKANVSDSACIMDSATVEGNAKIYGGAVIKSNAIVRDYAIVKEDAAIMSSVQIFGNAIIKGNTRIYENAKVYDNALVDDYTIVRGNAEICGHGQVKQSALIEGSGKVSQNQLALYGVTKTDLSKDFAASIKAQCNLPVINNKVIAYKLVRPDFTSFYDADFKYKVGEVVEVNDYESSNKSCATGLHFSNLTYWERVINGDFICLEAEIDLDDIITVQEGKIRCKKAKILRAFTMS